MKDGNGEVNGATLRLDKLVGLYQALQARVDALEEKKAPFKVELENVKGALLAYLEEHGLQNARAENGILVHKVTRTSASLADADAFMDYVRENDAFELMDRKANSTACREYAEEHGSLPPGVNISTRTSAEIRRK